MLLAWIVIEFWKGWAKKGIQIDVEWYIVFIRQNLLMHEVLSFVKKEYII